ncbi:hypothetical protein HH212_19225 [Massilia forsythiae]|uniref:Uncharacterized protein n=1 Tax=Massilia forsythiae TaxID=2728020 RepID=A0A7Z2ZTU5_9BURK|nr:hypothetical protein [Massilia forsythiae]QJE01888.1 hypothetical protein HH212_19225 [Massilia forsythiae]
MAELDLRWFDNPEDERQLKELVDAIGVLDANILSSNDVRQLLDVFERFPNDDGFESFWGIVHLLERAGGYESPLVESVRRSPGEFNLTMINRLLNRGIKHVGDQSLLSLLEDLALSERGNPNSARLAMHFVKYQRNKT